MDYIKFLQGKKTYILTLAAIVYALSGWYIGQFDQQTMMNMVWVALTATAMRAGISKM